MKLTENDMKILEVLARYYALSAPMIHSLCFSHRKDARHTRRRLAELSRGKLVRKSPVNVAFSTGNSGPAYTPTREGCEQLAVYKQDDVWLATYTKQPRLDRLFHWLEISWLHSVIVRACELSPAVELVQWINEWAPTLNVDGNPTGYVLHSQFHEQPPLSCSPDAAFMLNISGHRRVFYAECCRGTSGPTRIGSSKAPGYQELLLTQGHRRHFPATTFDDFSILLVTINTDYRDRLQKEFARRTNQNPELWLFADRNDVAPDTVLIDDVFMDHKGTVGPLVPGLTSTNKGVSDVA